ncbi:MAG TPA: hypothetical protein VK404_12355 [Spirosoma sp.]|nr:hypothetical protein [Spirosoma sp.]
MVGRDDQISGKNQQPFSIFYETYAPKLWGIILLAKLPASQSENILINTLKKAWQKLGQQVHPVEPTFATLLTLAYSEGLPGEFIHTIRQTPRPPTPMNANPLYLDRSVPVLIAGCTEADQALLTQSLEAGKLQVKATFTAKTDQVLPHLQASSADSHNFPRLLLMTVEERDGQTDWQLLQQIKASYRQLPIVMICTDQQGDTALQAYDLGVNSVLIKPFDLAEWKKTLASLAEYWLTVVTLPTQQRN